MDNGVDQFHREESFNSPPRWIRRGRYVASPSNRDEVRRTRSLADDQTSVKRIVGEEKGFFSCTYCVVKYLEIEGIAPTNTSQSSHW